MKTVALSGNKRAKIGSSNAKSLRKEELVPCVIYGGKENIYFTVNEIEFTKLVITPEVFFIDLSIDGKNVKAIIKDVQYHPVTDKVLHVDFLEVFEDKAVIVKLPVKLVGNAKGVLNGGTLRKATRKLTVSGLPSAIPEFIEIDITNLRIGQSIKVGEIEQEGLKLLNADNAVVVAVKRSRVLIEDEPSEEEDGEGEETKEGEGDAEAKAEETAATE